MKLRHLLIGMLALVASVSCKQDEPVEAPVLKVTLDDISLAATAAEQTVGLTTNQDWTATPDVDWLSVDPTSGKGSSSEITLKITADDNSTDAERKGNVKIKAGALTKTIKVSQVKSGDEAGPNNPQGDQKPTIKAFATEYVKLIKVYEETVGTVNYLEKNGVVDPSKTYDQPSFENVHYIPLTASITVAGKSYTTAQIFDVAIRSYLLLRGYDATDEAAVGAGSFAKLPKAYTMDQAFLPARDLLWGDYPYNESGSTDAAGATTGNGGPLKMGTPPVGEDKVKVDLLDNFAERNANFATVKNSNAIGNLASYSGRVEGYFGCASSMRMLLTYAYFFQYMLDNNLSDATEIPAEQTFNSFHFELSNGETPTPDPEPEPEVPADNIAVNATIKEFAQAYVRVIDLWNANKGTVNYVSPVGVIQEGATYGIPNIENVNYLPADATITVNGTDLTLPQAFDIAVRSYLLLRGYDATDEAPVGAGAFKKLDKAYTMDAKVFAARPYVYGATPYNEAGTTNADGSTSGNGGELKMGTPPNGINKVKVDLLDNFAERNANWPKNKNSNALGNMASYTNRVEGYYGCASAMRMILTYGYFFKYMLDNNLTDAASIAADVTFDTALFGEPEVPTLSGTGTEADPYVLSTAADMTKLKELTVAGQTTYFKLGADIDMASVKEWETVNYSEEENFGRLVNFDGDNHTISNFAPETFTGKYPSLFGIFAGTIKNVKFVGANIVGKGGPSAVIGGYLGNASKQLAAHIENVSIQGTFTTAEALTRFGAFGGLVYNTTFINCQADVTMTSEREDMGAFAGQATGEIVMKNCTAKVNLTNTRADNAHRTGGLIGYLTDKTTVGTFENCSVEGVIKDGGADTKSHSAFMGGLIGWAGIAEGSKLVVKNCTSKVNVEGNGFSNNIGCLIGNVGTGEIEMTDCTAEGTITAGVQVGGVVGLMEKAFGTYTGVTSKVTINCEAKNYVGGIVGRITAKDGAVTFTNCHSTGAITGGSSCAGILGAVDVASPAVDFIKCYATGDITGASNTGGIVGFHNGGVIKNCWYEGKIVGRGSVGGIAGTAYTTLIENSYVNSDMVVSANLAGGIFGQIHASTVSFEMKNCYATGNIEAGSGVGGLIGNLGVQTTAKIENCFSWAAKLISLKGADPTNYASGAIIANIGNNAKVYPESYIAALRNPALEFVDYSGSYPDATAGPETMTNTLCDHDDIVKDNLPPVLVPQDKGYKNDWAQRPYHGKAAAADATPCSIAKAFGWDEAVWDLSGALPKLK